MPHDPNIGDRVTVSTSRGILHGRVVGTERRDTTRNGSGDAVAHVCIALDPPDDAWVWVPAAQCTT